MRAIIMAALLLAAPAAAWAQEGEEIVVTGYRASAYEQKLIPAIAMVRRADAVLTNVSVGSDSRDAATRTREIRATLEDMQRRARSGQVTMALNQDDVVRPFSIDLAMRLLQYAGRADTSEVEVQLRTATTGPEDTLDAARARFTAFAESVSESGRAWVDLDVEDEDALQLTIVNIQQYRASLLTEISADARAIAAGMGPAYRPELSGLESPVAWRKTGDLNLTLFIDYHLRIVPAVAE